MSRRNRARRAIALLALAIVAPLRAQTTPAVDSVRQLNRAGQWRQAMDLASRKLESKPSPSQDESCSFQISLIYAAVQLGRYAAAAPQLDDIDKECRTSNASRMQASDLSAIRSTLASIPPLPKTGVDFSAIDQFWIVADVLARDKTPSESQWRALLATPGYYLAMLVTSTVPSDMEIALRPSRRAAFDSISKLSNDQSARVKHLAAAYAHRAGLARFRDSVTRSLPVQEAVARAAKFLPPHATEGVDPPLVAFALFRDDAYSLGPNGVVVDLYHVMSNPLTPLLSHEFHHSYELSLNKVPVPDGADGLLIFMLNNLRNEGIADLIDKPYPFVAAYPGNASFVKRYNEIYARTPAVVHSIDSVITIAADDSTQFRELGQRVTELLSSNGHFNGSYIAREVYETFGVDSLYPGVASTFGLLRAYAAAEVKRGNPPPFSLKTLAVFDSLERKYRRP